LGGESLALIGGTAEFTVSAIAVYQLWLPLYKSADDLRFAPSYILPDGTPVYGDLPPFEDN
jgi:hypothetical protein